MMNIKLIEQAVDTNFQVIDLTRPGIEPIPALSAKNKIKILPKKIRPTKDLKRPRGGTGGGGEEATFFLRTVG